MSRSNTAIHLFAHATLLIYAASITAATQGIPSLLLSEASSNAGCIEASPDGSGPTLAEVGLIVTVIVRLGDGNPLVGYPWQDVWLDTMPGDTGIQLCYPPPPRATTNANSQGQTTIERALTGGGSTTAGLRVMLAGSPLMGPNLEIEVRSADINGDLRVDAVDLNTVPGGFANLYLSGSYHPNIDLNCDGDLNLLDVSRFATRYLTAASCP